VLGSERSPVGPGSRRFYRNHPGGTPLLRALSSKSSSAARDSS
jgi:hypothetical protein